MLTFVCSLLRTLHLLFALRIGLPAAEFIVVEKDGKITANATLSGATKGATMDIAVAASNGTFWSIDGKKSITVGTDAK